MEAIPEWFKNKTVFITGGSGFIGKVLVEKLLRSCPDIESIYLLMRPKRGKSIEERIKKITDQPLFDVLRQQHPENLKKIKLVNGDVTKLGLGLCEDDRQVLVKEVHVIYHGAASVRFDDPLIDAILMNTRGTRETINLGLEMLNLQVFVHISTTYCHTDKKVIQEVMYPPLLDWQKAIRLAEKGDANLIEILTQKFIDPFPNTYTFTKRISENVVQDLCRDKLRAVIIRPSIVVSTAKEPMPGWIDNFNGPVGIMIAGGKGIVRTSYNDPDNIADYIPVDILVKGLIISAWKKATVDPPSPNNLDVSVYNGASNKYDPMTVRDITDVGLKLAWEYPLSTPLWYPGGSPTRCFYKFYLSFLLYHLIPALFVDGLLKLTGNKTLLLKIQRRIYAANMALQYFVLNEWTFENTNSSLLEDFLLTDDRDSFGFHREEINALQYFTEAVKGGRKYLMKEPDSNLDSAKRYMKKLWLLHLLFNFLWYTTLAWIVFVKFNLLSYFYAFITNVAQ